MEDASVLERRLKGDEDPEDLPLELLQSITNDFSEDRKIGRGGFGAVYKGVLPSGTIVAVKRIDVNKQTIDDKLYRREFNILRKINHQNVVRFLGFCSNSFKAPIEEADSKEINLANIRERLLCFEYINGSLDSHITDELRGLEWETRFEIILGICKGLRYLHEEKEIVHMDLKPENILLDVTHMVPKITDFGLSRPNKKTHTSGQRFGTRGYLAPEYANDGKTSVKSDIYSLGAIIIELVTGCLDVPDKNNVLRRWRHRWNKPPTSLQYQQVTRCIDVAVLCRLLDPRDRPSISEIISTLAKSETKDGHTNQVSPCFDEDDMLGIKPLELQIPYELKEAISSFTIQLTNDTYSCIAFNILSSRQQYIAQPVKGILQPRSKYDVKITMQTRDVHEHDHTNKFTLQSMKVSEDLIDEDIIESMFHKLDDKVVDEVSLMVVYEPAPTKRELNSPQLPKIAVISRHYPTNTRYIGKESDRAVDVSRGAMGSLLDKLGKLVTGDNNLEKSMKGDIESFSQELRKIHLVLPKLEKLDGVKDWVSKVRELSYNIEDMVDGLENGNNQICDVIRDIKNKVQDMVDEGNKYNSEFKIVADYETAKATTDLRISAEDEKDLIGIKVPRDEIIRLFEEDGADLPKQSLKILSIIGMGGLGKSALAKAVYDKMQAKYRPRAFVTVGQNADVKIVLKNILTECRKDAENMEHLDVPQLINQLQDLLKYKRYFIVIDDIWDSEAWNAISSAFPRNNRGSRVITTTRILDVADACVYAKKYLYPIKSLDDDDSRRLFFRRIFGPKETCPEALKDISVDILKRCGGMPLAINSIASLLAGEQESSWDYVSKNWSAVIEGNGLEKMKQILDLSYMYLPDYLKPCLLHVGMYQDPDIEMKDLFRQWVAEGFVHVSTNGGLDAEDVAERYITELMSMCIFQEGELDDESGQVLSLRVHPIVLDLIRLKSTKEKFIHVIDGSKVERGQIHRVAVHSNDKEDGRILEAIKEGSLSHVRSVFLYRSSLVPYFLEFRYIRVLHVEHKVPSRGLDLSGISRLFLLRYLKVTYVDNSGCELKLPDQIGKLQQLETIDLHNASLRNYPSDIVSLPWLSHLSSKGNEDGVVLPDGIEMLKNLHTLVGVDVFESSVHNIKAISKLNKLRKLHVCWKESVGLTSTLHMNALYSSISMLSASMRILTFGEGSVVMHDFPQLSRMPLFARGSHIRELDLGRCEFESCPEWIGQLHHLYKLRIVVKEVADSVSIVAGLTSLAYFHLMSLNDSEVRDESVVIPGGGQFRALKKLIFYCPKASLIFDAGAMPKLETLNIAFRSQMARPFLPVGVNHLPAGTLQEIWLCVLPGRLEGSQVVGQHRTNVRLMFKETFRPHHPTAKIVFVYGMYPVLIDEEDGNSEATSSSEAKSRCRIM
ncbi:unnamed protein product [Alopecurus aequalis]